MKKALSRIEKEEKVVNLMIDLYYRHHDKQLKTNSPECLDLKQYVKFRLSKCPFQENKTFCSNCKIHCYKPEYREKIKKVMRYSGPRMLFHHPIIAIKHVAETIKEKRKANKADEQNKTNKSK